MKVSGEVDSREAEGKDASRFTNPPAAAARLCARHGELDAHKIALKEQRRAKRARSKRRFAFWAEVARQIANGD